MTQSAQQALQEVDDYIKKANSILESGEYMELEGLDDKVRGLCETIAHMTPEEAKEYKDTLTRLMQDLDGLQSSLNNSKDKLKEELAGVQTHSQANHAYRKSSALNTPKED